MEGLGREEFVWLFHEHRASASGRIGDSRSGSVTVCFGSARDTPRPAVAIAGPIRPFPNEPPVAALEVLTLESAAVSDLPLHDLRAHGLRNTLSTNGTAQLSLVHANRPY